MKNNRYMPKPHKESSEIDIAGLYINHAIAITNRERVIAAVSANTWAVSQATLEELSMSAIRGTDLP